MWLKVFFWIALEKHLRNRILAAGKLTIITFTDSERLASNAAGVFSDLKQVSLMTCFTRASWMVKKSILRWSSVSFLYLSLSIGTWKLFYARMVFQCGLLFQTAHKDSQKNNFQVPILLWQLFDKWESEFQWEAARLMRMKANAFAQACYMWALVTVSVLVLQCGIHWNLSTSWSSSDPWLKSSVGIFRVRFLQWNRSHPFRVARSVAAMQAMNEGD